MTKYDVGVVIRMWVPVEASDARSARDRALAVLDKDFPQIMFDEKYDTTIDMDEVREDKEDISTAS